MTTHAPKVTRRRATSGRWIYRAECPPCGLIGPLVYEKAIAEKAVDGHRWENHMDEESA